MIPLNHPANVVIDDELDKKTYSFHNRHLIYVGKMVARAAKQIKRIETIMKQCKFESSSRVTVPLNLGQF